MSPSRKPLYPCGLAALHVAIRSGTTPLDLLGFSDNKASPQWLTIWYLVRMHRMSQIEVAKLIGTQRSNISDMLMRLEQLRRSDSRVDAWIRDMKLPAQVSDLTPCASDPLCI